MRLRLGGRDRRARGGRLRDVGVTKSTGGRWMMTKVTTVIAKMVITASTRRRAR